MEDEEMLNSNAVNAESLKYFEELLGTIEGYMLFNGTVWPSEGFMFFFTT